MLRVTRKFAVYVLLFQISRVSGQVGDRQLFLTKCSPGENCLPVLEIRNSEATLHDAPILYDLLGIPCDKIVYKKSFK